MPTVELRFRAMPGHVRTARLVAGVLARKAGVAEELLDEVRLAVAEACLRAVDIHRVRCPATPIMVRILDDDEVFRVEIRDCGELPDGRADALRVDGGPARGSGEAAVPSNLGLAVITGLVDDLAMEPDGDGLTLRMSWPTGVAG